MMKVKEKGKINVVRNHKIHSTRHPLLCIRLLQVRGTLSSTTDFRSTLRSIHLPRRIETQTIWTPVGTWVGIQQRQFHLSEHLHLHGDTTQPEHLKIKEKEEKRQDAARKRAAREKANNSEIYKQHLRGYDQTTNDDSEEDETTAEEKQTGVMQHSFPMVQVAGHDGPSVVYRPWTIKDMKEMMNDHLPDIQQDGEKFSTALILFCQQCSPTMPEIHRLLTLKIGPTHASHFTGLMNGHQHQMNTEWLHRTNEGYRDAIATLCAAIKAKFSAKVDMAKITACKQNPDESVNDYYHRLHLVFNANSGIQEPDGYPVGVVGVWETHLTNAFLNGLSSAISTSVRTSCIGFMDSARLEENRRHAIHAEKRLSEEKANDDKKRCDRKDKAQLTMVFSVAKVVSRPSR